MQTRDVGQYAANPWGFYDMHVCIRDGFNWRGGNLTDLVDPQGPESGVYRLQKEAHGTAIYMNYALLIKTITCQPEEVRLLFPCFQENPFQIIIQLNMILSTQQNPCLLALLWSLSLLNANPYIEYAITGAETTTMSTEDYHIEAG